MYQDSLEVDIDIDRDEVERVSSSAVTGRGEADLNCAAARKIVYLKTHKVRRATVNISHHLYCISVDSAPAVLCKTLCFDLEKRII